MAHCFVGRFEYRCLLVDIAAADPFVEIRALIQGTTLGAGPYGQFVAQAQCVKSAIECCLCFIGAAGIVGAAVVVDVIVTRAAEVRTFAGTPGKSAVVVDHHLAVRGTQGAGPAVVEAVLEAPAQVPRVDAHRVGPLLVGQTVVRIDVMGQAVAAE
ncbi:hypothetical protein D3C77_113150 [compost metagenome]